MHSVWNFDEPSFEVAGQHYASSEDYYHAQKPRPFNSDEWNAQRDQVMRSAVRYKFGRSADLRALLVSTHPHPLLSIKGDRYWGVGPDGVGENMLARVLMELRVEFLKAPDPPTAF